MHDQPAPLAAPERLPSSFVQPPPTTLGGILRRLGPGLIIAGSIVGSGELIGTTKTGAEAGFWLLWLILLGCVIKVFAQIELGRYSIVTGNTTMTGLNDVPGPRLGVNWLIWYWVVMFVVTMGQMGGIVGGVGQAMAISFPITGDFHQMLDVQAAGEAVKSARPYDDLIWAGIITVSTAIMLVMGRYSLIQNVSTFLVAGFTAVTLFCLVAQQMTAEWAVNWEDLKQGLSFRFPPDMKGAKPIATALATFGIIGVGANELIAYPYWCLEKGYATFTGPRDATASWGERARGWMRVMRADAWCSMVVYTFATVGFYLLGAGVLHRSGLNPAGDQMIHTLAEMYKPTFGDWAEQIFLFGAFAVLYSTFFVAIACHARVCSDAMRVGGLIKSGDAGRQRWVTILSGVLPFVAFGIYAWNKDPVTLVLLGGLAQAVMLPLLGFAAVYFRYFRNDQRVAPGKVWDICLWLSFATLLVTGSWAAVTNFEKLEAIAKSLFS